MPANRLKRFLDEQGVHYSSLVHPMAYTMQHTAEATHIPGSMMAKTVMVKLDGRMAMVIVPASSRVSLTALAKAVGVSEAVLASEAEFDALFPDVEGGAMPPFGNLYGVPVYVSEAFTHNPWIAFNAGTHTEVLEIAYADFDRLVQPAVLRCSTHEVLVGVGDTQGPPLEMESWR
jgi:Ala-tRNA(Pro) deacylase